MVGMWSRHWGSLLALPINIRLGWKRLTLTNPLAFFGNTIKRLECGVATGGSLLALPINIRLGWKCLTLINAVAFSGTGMFLQCNEGVVDRSSSLIILSSK